MENSVFSKAAIVQSAKISKKMKPTTANTIEASSANINNIIP